MATKKKTPPKNLDYDIHTDTELINLSHGFNKDLHSDRDILKKYHTPQIMEDPEFEKQARDHLTKTKTSDDYMRKTRDWVNRHKKNLRKGGKRKTKRNKKR